MKRDRNDFCSRYSGKSSAKVSAKMILFCSRRRKIRVSRIRHSRLECILTFVANRLDLGLRFVCGIDRENEFLKRFSGFCSKTFPGMLHGVGVDSWRSLDIPISLFSSESLSKAFDLILRIRHVHSMTLNGRNVCSRAN